MCIVEPFLLHNYSISSFSLVTQKCNYTVGVVIFFLPHQLSLYLLNIRDLGSLLMVGNRNNRSKNLTKGKNLQELLKFSGEKAKIKI